MFKNAMVYTCTSAIDLAQFAEAIDGSTISDSDMLNKERTGFSALVEGCDKNALVTMNRLLFKWAIDKKSVPSHAISHLLNERVKEIEIREGRKVGRKEKADMKLKAETELMGKSTHKRSFCFGFIDERSSRVYLNTPSETVADIVLADLRKVFGGSFPVERFTHGKVSAPSLMRDWLVDFDSPATLELGYKTELSDFKGSDAIEMTFKKIHVREPDIIFPLTQSGLLVKSMEMVWEEKIEFVLTNELVIKSMKFKDIVKDDLSNKKQDAAGGMGDDDMVALVLLESMFLVESQYVMELVGAIGRIFAAPAN